MPKGITYEPVTNEDGILQDVTKQTTAYIFSLPDYSYVICVFIFMVILATIIYKCFNLNVSKKKAIKDRLNRRKQE